MAEAELTTIARPYARAAFSFAVDQASTSGNGGLAEWSRMLALLASAIEQRAVREYLDDPVLTTAQGAQFLIELMGDELSDSGRNFVNVLAENGRMELLPNIAQLYELLKVEHEKTVNVEVTSAFDVSDDEARNLVEVLQNRLQRDVNLSTEVDATLLGGVIVRAEDTVIDESIKGRLRKLSQALS